MKRKLFSKLLATALSLSLLGMYSTLFSGVIFAAGTTPFIVDQFDDQAYTNVSWTTVGTKTTDFTYGTDGTFAYLKPAVNATQNKSFTYVKNTVWPTDRVKEVEVRFKLNSAGTAGWISRNFNFYFDPDTQTYAGLEFSVLSTASKILQFRSAAGPLATMSGTANAPTDTTANRTTYTADQWVKVTATYDYTNFYSVPRQLGIKFTIVLETAGVNWVTDETRTVTLPTHASQKVNYAQTNDTVPGNTMIDYVKINQTEAVTDQQIADSFTAGYATLLAKDTTAVTIAADDVTIADALTTYNSLSSSVKALLTTSYTKLTAMQSYLKSTVAPFSTDEFDNQTYSNAAFVTSKLNASATLSSDFSYGSAGTENFMYPSINSNALGTYTAMTYVRNSYWSDGKIKKVSMKFKLDASTGFNGKTLCFYFDPDTKAWSGLEFTTQAAGNGMIQGRNAAGNGAAQGGGNIIPTDTTQNRIDFAANQWVNVVADYTYTNFNAATRQIVIKFNITMENGKVLLANDSRTVTVPSWASQKVSVGVCNDIQSSKLAVYNISVLDRDVTDQEGANNFKLTYAALLAKDVNAVTIADDSNSVTQALTAYNSLSASVKALLTAEYTKLTQMNSYLISIIPQFTSDSFDYPLLSNNYWKTTLYAETLASGYTFSTVDGSSVLNLPRVTGTTTWNGISSVTTIDSQYVQTAKPKTVTVRAKLDQLNAYGDGVLYFYYDPATGYRAGIDMQMGNNSTTDAIFRPFKTGTITTGGANQSLGLQPGGWYTIEAKYDYSSFNAATRAIMITYTVKNASNTVLGSTTYTYYIPSDASNKISFGFGNDTQLDRTKIDYINFEYQEVAATVISANVTKNAVVTGTAIATALGSTVPVVNSSGTIKNVAVTWNGADYNTDVPGIYTVYGTLNESGTNSLAAYNLTNPDNVSAVATIEVKAAILHGYIASGTTMKNITASSSLTEESFLSHISLGSGTSVNFSNQAASGKVGTGTVVKIINGESTLTYTVLIYGDITGDGAIDVCDLIAIKKHMLNEELFAEGSQLLACDVDKNGSISICDLLAVKEQSLGLLTISQN